MSAVRVSKTRTTLSYVFIVLGIVFVVISMLANFVRREALDTEHFSKTSEALIADPAIQTAVAATLVDGLYSNVDVAAELRQKLPENLQPLAGPIAGASRELTNRAALELLQRPRFQEVFVTAAGAAQKQVVAVLEDDARALQTTNGNVVLDLRPLVVALGDRFNIIANIADRVPQDAARVTIVKSNDLETAQTMIQLLKVVANWIWVLAIASWALAVWLVRGRRRRAVLSIAVGLVIASIAVLAIRSLSTGYFVDHLVKSETVRPAVSNALGIVTNSLAATAWTLMWVGLIAVAGTWLAGGGLRATAARRRLAPYLARPGVAYAALAVAFLLFIWWSPLVGPRNVVILGVLAIVGLEVLRRQTEREFPAVRREPAEPVVGPGDEVPSAPGGTTPAA